MKISHQIFAVAGLLTMLTGCVTATSSGLDDAVRYYNDVGYGGSPNGTPMTGQILAETDYNDKRLNRWQSSIRLKVVGDSAQKYRPKIEKMATQISTIIDREFIHLPPNDNTANFVIEFSDAPGFVLMTTEKGLCITRTRTDSDGSISEISIRISTIDPSIIDHCIAHEIFHGLGFSHSEIMPSVIGQRGQLMQFSRWDKLAMRVHYDRELAAGMTRRQSLPIARRLIAKQLATWTKS